MATFTIDLLTGNLYLFSGNFSGSGSTPTSGSTYPQVNLYSDLPPAGGYSGQVYLVRSGSGSYVLNRKDAGLYFSNGVSWNNMPMIPPYFSSANFQVYDSVANSKGLQFITSGLTAGVFRKLKVQDSDGTIAYLTDLQAKVDTSVFNHYTGITAPNTYLTKVVFSTFTGTTLPTNYYNKTQINAYTGATLLLIGNKLNTSTFAYYTGTTAPSQFASKANSITGATNLGGGTGIYTSVSANKVQLKSLSAGTGISISNTTNAITICSTASGSGTITGATNGLGVSGKNICLGGALTNNTTITSGNFIYCIAGTQSNYRQDNSSACMTVGGSNGPQVRVSLCGATLEACCSRLLVSSGGTIFCSGAVSDCAGIKYNADYSSHYTDRSLIDRGYALSQFSSKANAVTGATNLGSGTGIYTSVSANKLQLKSIKGAGNVSISNDGTSITISGSSSGGATWSTLSGRPAWLTGTTLQIFQTGHTHSYNNLTDKLTAGIGISINNNVISATGSGSGSTTTTLQLLDTNGGTDVNTVAATSVIWTSQVFSGTSLSFTGGSRIYVKANGVYEISYALNAVNNDNSTKNIGSVIRKNGDTDITPLSSSSLSVDLTNNTSTNALPQYLVSLSSGDYVELKGFRIGNSGMVITKPNGSWIKVKRIS